MAVARRGGTVSTIDGRAARPAAPAHDFWPVSPVAGGATVSAYLGNKENSVRTRHLMLLLSGLLLASAAQAAETANPDAWELPIATRTLDNGLTVVVSEDHSAPVVGVS